MLMFLALIRELFSPSTVSSRIRFVALLEAFSHRVSFLIGLGTEVHVVFIMLVDLVEVLALRNTMRHCLVKWV